MITDWVTFNSLSNESRELKSSANNTMTTQMVDILLLSTYLLATYQPFASPLYIGMLLTIKFPTHPHPIHCIIFRFRNCSDLVPAEWRFLQWNKLSSERCLKVAKREVKDKLGPHWQGVDPSISWESPSELRQPKES